MPAGFSGVARRRYKERLIGLLHDAGAVKLGKFELKSGGESPYFVDVSQLLSGPQNAKELAWCYAGAIYDSVGLGNFDVVFGPPDKGSPLSLLVAMELDGLGKPKSVIYGRKTPKDHGEGGAQGWSSWFYGHVPSDTDRVLFLDDVYTRGASTGQYKDLMERLSGDAGLSAPLEYVATVVAFDRQESRRDDVYAVVTAREFFAHPRTRRELGVEWEVCMDYLDDNCYQAPPGSTPEL
jgi:orotate phosphoribosyltransferase